MFKNIFAFVCLILIFVSCTDPTSVEKNTMIKNFEINNLLPLEIGNEWNYEINFYNENQFSLISTKHEKMIVKSKTTLNEIEAFELVHYIDGEKYATSYVTTNKDQIWLYSNDLEPYVFNDENISKYANATAGYATAMSECEECMDFDAKWIKIFDQNDPDWDEIQEVEGNTYPVYYVDTTGIEDELVESLTRTKLYRNMEFSLYFDRQISSEDYYKNKKVNSKWIKLSGDVFFEIDSDSSDAEIKFKNSHSNQLNILKFDVEIQFIQDIGIGNIISLQDYELAGDTQNNIKIRCERKLVDYKLK